MCDGDGDDGGGEWFGVGPFAVWAARNNTTLRCLKHTTNTHSSFAFLEKYIDDIFYHGYTSRLSFFFFSTVHPTKN